MAKTHPHCYPLEFRQNVVELARAGKKPEKLGKLRKKVRQLEIERDIL